MLLHLLYCCIYYLLANENLFVALLVNNINLKVTV